MSSQVAAARGQDWLGGILGIQELAESVLAAGGSHAAHALLTTSSTFKDALTEPLRRSVTRCICFLGGKAVQGIATKESFDRSASLKLPPIQTDRLDFALVAVGSLLYVMGGSTDLTDQRRRKIWALVKCLDIECGNWKTLPKMPTPRFALGAAHSSGMLIQHGMDQHLHVHVSNILTV